MVKYRKLGKTDLNVSEIGFGCWGLGSDKSTGYGKINLSEAIKALDFAFDSGINMFDTAALYGNGFSEAILGKTFKKKRSKIYFATKGGVLPHKTLYMPQNFSKEFLKKSLENSLKRLKTDYIDLYQLHSPKAEHVINTDVVDTLSDFKKEGKIRYFGISTRSPQDGLSFLKLKGLSALQLNFNLIDQRILDLNFFDIIKDNKIGIIIKTPLVFGFLTGLITQAQIKDKKDHRKLFPEGQIKIWENSVYLFKEMHKGLSPSQFALRYCLDFKKISCIIPGMVNVSEVKENISSSELKSLSKKKHGLIRKIYLQNSFYLKSLKGTKDKKND